MGALTSNRKRKDEYLNLQCPSPLFNYNNQLEKIDDNHNPKRPRLSYTESPTAAVTATVTPLSRLSKYPVPEKLPREFHAPCRFSRLGFLSKRVVSGIQSKMGNVLVASYKRLRTNLLSPFLSVNHEKEKEVIDLDAEPQKDGGVLKDSGVVEVLEDGNEVRSVVSDDHRVLESDGLELEIQNLDGKGVDSGAAKVCSMISDLSNIEDARKMLGSISLSREAYKDLMYAVDKAYSTKLRSLEFEIRATEAQLQSIQLEKPEKKPAELEEPREDLLREPFVPLTEEEEREVARALSHSNRRKVLVTHENSNIEITGEILRCLRPGAWLNDEVINVYLELLKERERREPKKFLNCHFFNTFFYKKLIGGRNGYDYKAVRRWTTQKKLGYGLVDCEKIFVPIHREVHWCLAVINKRDKSLQYLDSLGGRDHKVLRVLAQYYMDEVKDKSGQEIDVKSWNQDFVEDLPEQQNGFDCGVFMIKYADFYSRGLGLHFSQENMPYFRLRTAKEILRLRAD